MLLTTTLAGTFGLAYGLNKVALALLLRALRMDGRGGGLKLKAAAGD